MRNFLSHALDRVKGLLDTMEWTARSAIKIHKEANHYWWILDHINSISVDERTKSLVGPQLTDVLQKTFAGLIGRSDWEHKHAGENKWVTDCRNLLMRLRSRQLGGDTGGRSTR